MLPPDCPAWEYDNHPDRGRLLRRTTHSILTQLRTGELPTRELARDTRSAHGEMFADLAPPEAPYYAGHYRGEPFRCLRDYPVYIPSDRRVGSPPRLVPAQMELAAGQLDRALAALDTASDAPEIEPATKVQYAVAVACRFMEALHRVHPYANGNGHMARLLVWAITGRYGYWPTGLSVEPRPQDPNYISLIERYRNGDWQPLEEYVLKQLAGA